MATSDGRRLVGRRNVGDWGRTPGFARSRQYLGSPPELPDSIEVEDFLIRGVPDPRNLPAHWESKDRTGGWLRG